METFKYNRSNRSNPNFVINDEEEAEVNPVLEKLTTKKAAIEFLAGRGWTTKQICAKIQYDDGRNLREQHVNQVKQRMSK